MYKNCYVTRGEEYGYYNIHLWDDNGYSVEEFHNFAYEECYYEKVGDYYIVYRKRDKKVMKSINYFRPDLSKFLKNV